MPIGAVRYASLILRADPDILEHIRDALDCGADDIVGTDISNPELTHRIQIHQDHLRTNAILRESSIIGLNAAVTDPLTGLLQSPLRTIAYQSFVRGRAFQWGQCYSVNGGY